MKFVKVIAVFLSTVMFSMSVMSSVVFGDFVVTDEEYDPETGFTFVLLEDDTYAIRGFEIDYNEIPEELIIPNEFKEKSVSTIETDTFNNFWYDPSPVSIVIPENIKNINDCSLLGSFNEFKVDSNNLNYTSIDGVLYNKDVTELIQYPPFKDDISFTIPEGVYKINMHAIRDTQKLEKITLSDTITELEDTAFCSDSLKEIVLSNSLTTIKQHTFVLCGSLDTIKFPTSVSVIEGGAFDRCKSLRSFDIDENNASYKVVEGVLYTKDGKALIAYPNGKSDSVYNIQTGTETIGEYAFRENSFLETVFIPDTVTNIEFDAFSYTHIRHITIPEGIKSLGFTFKYCDYLEKIELPKTLTEIRGAFKTFQKDPLKLTIKYAGNQEDWENIKITADSKDRINDATIVFDDGTTDTIVIDSKNETNKPIQEANSVINTKDNSTVFTPQVMCNSTLSSIIEAVETIKKIRINAKENTFSDNIKLCANPSTNRVSANNDFAVDIHFENNSGEEVKPNKPVTVKIPVPTRFIGKDTFYVYHIDDENKIEKIEFEVKEIEGIKYIIFETDSFSTYILSEQNVNVTQPETTTTETTSSEPTAPETTTVETTAAEITPAETAETETSNPDTSVIGTSKPDVSNNGSDDESISTVPVETNFPVATDNKTDNVSSNSNKGDGIPNTGTQSHATFYLTVGFISLLIFMLLCLFTGKNGMSEKNKNQAVKKLVSWGKKGGKLHTIVALVAIFIILAFYYSIGMKVSEASEN